MMTGRCGWLLVALAGALVLLPVARLGATSAAEVGGCAGTVPARMLTATPSDYLSVLATVQPGDLLQLAAGNYPSGLPLWNLHGSEDSCIIIEGPESGPAAVFTGRDCCNTVSIGDSSYLVVRNLELDGQGRAGDGVKAEGTATSAHHITIENLYIHGHGADQQIVGINTKCPVWSWVIRRNIIEAAGTGLYLGNSDGEDEFADGLIEHNLVVDTLGYNLQIKHQNGRATGLGSPADAVTIIRHNVFSKADNASTGYNARPNLLVGHWPLSGAGSNDDYLIYGNFFYQNPTAEALLQAEGNVILYQNLFVCETGSAVTFQPHNDVPRRIEAFQNTVVAPGTGINVSGGDPSHDQRIIGNAVFAGTPLSGGQQNDNITDAYGTAGSYLSNPFGVITGSSNRLDLYPLSGTLDGSAINRTGLELYEDWNRDFNSAARAGTYRGAYADDGANPGWPPALERKPDSTLFSDDFESGNLTRWSASVP
jgi:hypothetical protein